MYSDPSLPLRSQIRRPWSPNCYEQQRREPTDASIQALDLADYAMTLDTPSRQSLYTPESIPRPTDSHADTPSFESSNNTYHTAPLNPVRRPFSLPNTASLSSHATSSRTQTHRSPRILEQTRVQSPSEEIDISHFPKWSQSWYNNKPNTSQKDPDADIYTPVPLSFDLAGLNKNSVFDPGYVHDPNASDPYGIRSPPLYSPIHGSSRDILPWSNDAPQYELPLDPTLREERMRMLEKEFGNKSQGTKKDDPLVDQNGKPVVGTVDDHGRLVTVGPRKRIFIRLLQILLALAAAVPSIYVALVSFLLISLLISNPSSRQSNL